jgi:SPP1 family predicted phage head-tail adaptor
MSTRWTGAGRRRHLINIMQPSATQSSFGDLTPATVPFASGVWAEISEVQDRELYRTQQFVSEVTHRMNIRYIAGVVPKMQVVFQGRTFQIQAVSNPEMRNRELNLLCLERQ